MNLLCFHGLDHLHTSMNFYEKQKLSILTCSSVQQQDGLLVVSFIGILLSLELIDFFLMRTALNHYYQIINGFGN